MTQRAGETHAGNQEIEAGGRVSPGTDGAAAGGDGVRVPAARLCVRLLLKLLEELFVNFKSSDGPQAEFKFT